MLYNQALESNFKEAKKQYGEAFKSKELKAEIKEIVCELKNEVHNCKVRFMVDNRSKTTLVLLNKEQDDWKLAQPIVIK